MKNFVVNNTVITNASEAPPTGLRLYFSKTLSMAERSTVVEVLKYWIDATPIVGNDYAGYVVFAWEDDGQQQQLTINANFYRGNFRGDLLYHNAIGLGDERFSIGLVRLFNEGYTPKTKRGKGVTRADVSPICIEFLYDDETLIEKDNQELWNAIGDTIDGLVAIRAALLNNKV